VPDSVIGPSVDADWEHPRTGADAAPGSSEAVTFAFGDPAANVFGIARIGLSADADGDVTASGLVVLFADGEPIAVRADGGVAVDRVAWDAIDAAGIHSTIEEPLHAWTVSFTANEAGTGFALRFASSSSPAVLEESHPAATTGGMSGYESLCRVQGTVTAAGVVRSVDGMGQRGHSWGAPDWERLSVARTLNAWFGEDLGVTITAIRDDRATAHDAEIIAAFLFEPEDEGPPGTFPHLVSDPLLSTRYDADGRQQSAGLELYVTEDGYARRIAGEVVCGTTLDLGRLRLDCAFFRWRMEGREGVGRYDVLRRA
jgi:hypothetical protein